MLASSFCQGIVVKLSNTFAGMISQGGEEEIQFDCEFVTADMLSGKMHMGHSPKLCTSFVT